MLSFRFPTVKLLDYAGREEALESDPNPFAIITLAHLKTQATRHDDRERQVWKIRLLKGLYQRGYRAEQVRRLYTVLDWLVRLPEEAGKTVWKEIEAIEKEKAMPYITSVEKMGIEKGRSDGREEALENVARNLMAIGRPVSEIAQVTGLNEDQIRQLKMPEK